MKYHIEKNTVQETLVIPLFGHLICSERFPQLFSDLEAKRINDSQDYDFAEKRKKMEPPAGLFSALKVAQRQYDLYCEVKAYLKEHSKSAVVNLGCGLDDTFSTRKTDSAVAIAWTSRCDRGSERTSSRRRKGNSLACDLNNVDGSDRRRKRSGILCRGRIVLLA